MDLIGKAKDLVVLIWKVVSFRYGQRYWSVQEEEYYSGIGEEKDIRKHIKMAKRYLGRGQKEKALEAGKRIQELDRGEKEGYRVTAEALYMMGRGKEAEGEIAKVLEMGEERWSRRLLGKIRRDEGKYEESIREYRKALVEVGAWEDEELAVYKEMIGVYKEKGLEGEGESGEVKKLIGMVIGKGKRIRGMHFEMGKVLYREGKLEEAIGELRQELKVSGDNLDTHIILAKAYKEVGRYKESQEEYGKVLGLLVPEDKGKRLEIRLELAEIDVEEKRYEDAEEGLREIVGMEGRNVRARVLLGRLYKETGRYKESQGEYGKVLGLLGPEDKGKRQETRLELAEIDIEEKRYEEAEEGLREIVGMEGENVRARVLLGRLYKETGRYKESQEEYGKVLGLLVPEDKGKRLEIRLELAEIDVEEKRYEEAEEGLREIVGIEGGNVRARMLLGRLYKEVGRYKESQEEYGKVLGLLVPEDKGKRLEIRLEIAEIDIAEKRYEEAEEGLREIVGIEGENVRARVLLGRLYKEVGRYKESQGEYGKVLGLLVPEDKGKRLETRLEIAEIDIEEKRYEEAEEGLREIVGMEGGNVKARMMLGRLYKEKGKYKESLEEYRKALSLTGPEDKGKGLEIRLELAEIDIEEKRYEEAEEELREIVGIEGENVRARIMLGGLYRETGKYKESLEEYGRAERAAGEDKADMLREIERGLGQVYYEQGEYVIAEKYLKKTSRIVSDIYTLLNLLEVYAVQKKEKESGDVVKVILNKWGNSEEKDLVIEKLLEIVKKCNLADKEKVVSVICREVLDRDMVSDRRVRNIFINEKEIAEGECELESKVRNLKVCLTNKCNLNCRMCGVKGHFNEDISDKTKQEIIKNMVCLEEITWVGGEVFLYPDFEELVDKAIAQGVRQTIITNCLLMDEKTAEKLIKSNINFVISIDGTTKEVYEKIRRGGNFDKLVENLEMINRIRSNNSSLCALRLNTVVMRSNYHQIGSFVGFAKKYGFNAINYLLPVENFCNENIFIKNEEKDVKKMIYKAFRNAEDRCKEYKIVYTNGITEQALSVNTEKCKHCEYLTEKDELQILNNSEKCLAPWKTFYIKTDGGVYPHSYCNCNNEVGNLNEESLEEVWNGKKIVEYRKKIMEGKIDEMCSLRKIYGRVPYELMNN